MNTQSESTGSRRLLRDDRGAILVVAVFMAAFLVGALWYIIGIGDTILYRERMQDGADAAAYAAAVYHARGMNLIVLLNIIMAGILAVLVALKLLQIINAIGLVVSTAICSVSFGTWGAFFCYAATVTGRLTQPIQKTIDTYQKFVQKVLPPLSKTQRGIAEAMPWVAEARAVYVASAYYKKPVTTGMMVSTSLVPGETNGQVAFGGHRLGLPVQEASPFVLCQHAGQYVAHVVFLPFGSAIGNWLAGITGLVTGGFAGYFCNLSNRQAGAMGIDLNKKAAEQVCSAKEKQNQKNGGGKFDQAKCLADEAKKLNEKAQKKVGGLKGVWSKAQGYNVGGMNSQGATCKQVFTGAKNGNGYFQIWSFVKGDEQWPQTADRGVEIAAWNHGMPVPTTSWGKLGFAEAEFYYDAPGNWIFLEQDAMWNMLWRARLRRVRPATPNIGSILGGVLGKKLAQKSLSKTIDEMAGDPKIGSILFKKTQQVNGLTKLLKWGGGKLDKATSNVALDQYNKLGVIH